jgi:hypothetical protein
MNYDEDQPSPDMEYLQYQMENPGMHDVPTAPKPDGEDQLVRDACTIGYYGPKSEYRRRLRAHVANELRGIRDQYDRMEEREMHLSEPEREVTWKGWKWVRNVITDRIEELTGKRQ